MKLQKDDLGILGVVVADWDITQPFKPKTITTDYTSWITYISRKAVPANTPITNTEYWKPLTRLQAQLAFDYITFKKNIEALVYSFLETSESGVAFANEFGTRSYIGVNQKTLTEAIGRIWNKLEDITGEVLQGISMVVTPSYYIGENGCTVNISANTVDINGKFEYIKFYLNGVLLDEAEDVNSFNTTTEISETTVVRCEAQILGIPYEEEKTIIHHPSFWLGAGTAYTQIMNISHIVSTNNNMRGAYDVTANAGDHIYIVMAASLRDGFIRADINGAEIPFTETTVTIDGNSYVVLTSENTYQAGTYNIDING